MIKPIKDFLSKLFSRKHVKYIGTLKCQLVSMLPSDSAQDVIIAVYKKYDPITGKVYAVWGEGHGSKIHFNVDAFAYGKFIEK